MRPYRRQMQMIFQDPFSVEPAHVGWRHRLRAAVVHGIANGEEKAQGMAGEIFDQVGLRRSQMNAFPHEFSGGQRQRISIARALASIPS